MKKLTIIIAFLLSQVLLNAQTDDSCLPQGITFDTQEQIDNFQTNYPDCTEIEGDVNILGNNITNLNGLSMLNSIGGDLRVDANGTLTSLMGLEGLTSIGGGLCLQYNYSLSSLTGLKGLTTIGGDLHIGYWYQAGNPFLTTLTGLEGLTSIGGGLFIENNDALTSLTGLEKLTTIGGGLSIHTNDALTSLAGLDSIKANSIQSLWIWANSTLSICAIESLCEYIATPNVAIEIGFNAPGCANLAQVEEACIYLHVSEDDNMNPIEMNISPSPVGDFATLNFNADQPGLALVEIYNSTGLKVRSRQLILNNAGQNNFILNFRSLPTGMYFCTVHIGNKQLTQKILKR